MNKQQKMRLFAMAATIGMFTTTISVAAATAKPKTFTQVIQSGETVWTGVHDIVKVEFGGKLVLPTGVKASAFLETRTTNKADSIDGIAYAGLTNKKTVDSNGDGIVDTPFYVIDSEWTNDEGQYFNSEAEAVEYLKSRFIVGEKDGQEGFRITEDIKDYDGDVVIKKGWFEFDEKSIKEFIDKLDEAGLITTLYETDSRNNEYLVGFELGHKEVMHSNKKDVEKEQFYKVTIRDDYSSRYVEEELREALIRLISGDATWNKVGKTNAFVGETYERSYYVDTDKELLATYASEDGSVVFDDAAQKTNGAYIVVQEDRYGNYVIVEPLTLLPVTDEYVLYEDTNVKVYKGRITMIEQYRSGSTTSYSAFSTVRPKKNGNTAQHRYIYSESDAMFLRQDVVATSSSADLTPKAKDFGSIKYVNSPAGIEGKVIVDVEIDYDGISIQKEEMTLTDTNNNTFKVPATKVDGRWYPIVDEDYLETFLYRMGVVKEANSAWFNMYEDDMKPGVRTWIDGTKDEKYYPQNYLDNPIAEQVTYRKTKGTEQTELTVSVDTSKFNPNEYGVQKVKYEAKLDNKVVSTKEISVVIAPKYTRTWKDGKVASLRAYHLNGKLYAEYVYDYKDGTVTTTFYEFDGETVNSIAKTKI